MRETRKQKKKTAQHPETNPNRPKPQHNPFPTQAQLSPPLLAQRTPRPSRCSARTERSPAPHALASPADIPGPHVSTIPSPFLSLSSATPRRVHRRNRRRFPFPNRARDPRILPLNSPESFPLRSTLFFPRNLPRKPSRRSCPALRRPEVRTIRRRDFSPSMRIGPI